MQEDNKKTLKIAKENFLKLKTDPASVAFAEETLNKKLLFKLKKSKYVKDITFFKIVNLLSENDAILELDSGNVKRTDYVEKREIDRSTLYSFDAPFRLFHADVGNLEFLGKNASFPQYVLVLVDLFSSKIYTYPMKSRKQIRQKLEQFYRDVKSKRRGKTMKLQVDQEFQQVKIQDLNDLNNAKMFSTSLRGGKPFVAEQKIRELKTRIAKLHGQKLKISPKIIIEMSTANMKILPSKKYGFSPEEVEDRALKSEKFRTVYNMHRLEKTNKLNQRLDRDDKKKFSRKKKKLRENLMVGEKVSDLAERIKKKSAPGKFYKQSVQNIGYFNKETVFTVRKKKTINNIKYFWVKSLFREISKCFSRSELFALKSNFL